MQTKKKAIIRSVKIFIALILFIYILSKIDFKELISIFERSNKWAIAIAFTSFPLKYLIFTIRWKYILNHFSDISISFLELYRITYRGLFVGYFIPGSIGVDVYRVLAMKQSRVTVLNLSLIFHEKLMGILVCGILVLSSSFFIDLADFQYINLISYTVYICLFIICFLLIVGLIFRNSHMIRKLSREFEEKIQMVIWKFSSKFNRVVVFKEGFLTKMVSFLINPKFILSIITFSIINQLAGVILSNVLFHGLGANLNFVQNLFANPLLNIIFLLPISFGGIGVREGAYILIFGIFGVSSEMSLVASFIFLSSTILNISIGGVIYLVDKSKSKIDG